MGVIFTVRLPDSPPERVTGLTGQFPCLSPSGPPDASLHLYGAIEWDPSMSMRFLPFNTYGVMRPLFRSQPERFNDFQPLFLCQYPGKR